MAFKLNKNDQELLAFLAECRVLTLSQVASIQKKSKQVTRRRMRALEEAGVILSGTQGFGRFRGRPGKFLSVARKGADLLNLEGIPLENVIYNFNEENLRLLDHQILVNWFRIHLQYIEQVIPQLSIQFLSPTSPFLKRDQDNRPFIFEPHPIEGRERQSNGFTPDGVFSISHSEKNKTLLFFLEVDLGTESIASPKRHPRDIRQKVTNYQRHFQSGQYKRYEKIWNCSLKGFRLLFLTNTNGRLAALCRLVQQMPPSDFVWLTDQERMFSHGLSAEIWFPGGRQDTPPESILGPEMASQIPIPSLKE